MKSLFTFLITILTFHSFGQVQNPKLQNLKVSTFHVNDSILKVYYDTTLLAVPNQAFIINGQFLSSFSTINPNLIESIDVIKRDTTIAHVQYYGIIKIRTKPDHNIKPISLTQLKLKYTNLKNNTAVFIVDNQIINTGDYGNYFVDENFIFKIIVQKITNEKEGLELNVVKLFTKSEENILKSKDIRLRGLQDMTMNK